MMIISLVKNLREFPLTCFTETYAELRKKIINTIESVSYNFLEVFIACVLKTIDKNSFNKRDIN